MQTENDGYWNGFYNIESRAFPPVDPAVFSASAKQFRPLYDDARKLTEMIGSSPQFASEMMAHAQVNEKNKVLAMIKNAGIISRTDIKYTPDTLAIILYAANDCCQLIMRLNWR